jgi:CO/xanthine dehydrogenase FAD-binding subunit
MLKEIDMVVPKSMNEALHILAEKKEKAQPLAGGTNIVLELQNGSQKELLVELGMLKELTGITREGHTIILGSATKLADVLKSELIAKYGVPLHEAAAKFATPMIRNLATAGGNLVDASPAADTAPPLLALGAEMELQSIHQTRFVPIDEFFLGVNKTVRQPDELLITIRWQIPSKKCAGGFEKIGLRKGMVCSIISASIQVEIDEQQKVSRARIALGAVAPQPIRSYPAEDYLEGKILTGEVILEAGRLASESSRPIDDIRGSADYRRKMSDVLVQRLLKRIARTLAG